MALSPASLPLRTYMSQVGILSLGLLYQVQELRLQELGGHFRGVASLKHG